MKAIVCGAGIAGLTVAWWLERDGWQVELVESADFGPERHFLRYLGYHTASYVLDDEDVRARVGDRFLLVAAPGRQAGLYPADDGDRLAASLIHATPDPALPPNPHATVRTVYGQLGGLVRRALRHCPDRPELFYDQAAQVEMEGWHRGPVILVGDACQAVSLLAGEGASVAMTGAYVLADELCNGATVDAAAARYEQRLRAAVSDKQKAGRANARWLVPGKQWQIAARRAALAAARLPGGTQFVRSRFGATSAPIVPAGIRQAVPVS